MGVSMRCLDPAEDAPAAVAAAQSVGHFRDAAAIAAFAKTVDVLTVEIEHIDADALEAAAKASGVDVEPTPATVRVIQARAARSAAPQPHRLGAPAAARSLSRAPQRMRGCAPSRPLPPPTAPPAGQVRAEGAL